jgi:hypothetical protein
LTSAPVAFFIFNRPDLTARVFAEITRAKPSMLLVVADGPRSSEEQRKCAEARSIIDQVDWDCEVRTNYSDVNLGCKRRMSSGLDWVFEQREEAIILEDDCVPDPSFFPFCVELLERYRNDKRIAMISGDNFQLGRKRTKHSYYFSRYMHVWGWASWRRAWRHYDVEMKRWPALRKTPWLMTMVDDAAQLEYWRGIFDEVFSGKLDTWDYQWFFACWTQNSLAAVPNSNLVSNIGFGMAATHTTELDSPVADLATLPMSMPLSHPRKIMRHRQADSYGFEHGLRWWRTQDQLSLYETFQRELSNVQFRVKAAIHRLSMKSRGNDV